jgi:uncharacterized protein (TIGR02246 family)
VRACPIRSASRGGFRGARRGLPWAGFLILILLLAPLPARADEELSDLESQIRALLGAQVEAWNEGDLEGFMAAYESSPELVFASGDQVSYGWQTTLERYQMRYNGPEQMGQLAFEVLQVDPLGSEYAKVLGRWQLSREDDSPHGVFTLILAQRDGAWRIIHDHTSAADE